jgi:hypothetical protein
MLKQRGGKREGSGRKKGEATLVGERIRNKISEMIEKEQVPLIKALLDKAKKGDVFAFKELFDRAFGRASQAIELSGKDGKDLPIPILKIQNVFTNHSNTEDNSSNEED